MLAEVSVEYYSRLERGSIGGASAAVLEAVAGALHLDETERAHLLDLARTADGIPNSGRARRRSAGTSAQRVSLHWALDAITDAVAFVRNAHQDLLATNALGRAFYSPVIGDGGRTPNLARFQFLDPASRDFYPDWDLFAEMCVGIMRAEAGRDPHNKALQDLVGELSTRSETFRTLWAAHNVRTHGTGTKRFHHPVVGDLTLAYEELAITADPGTVMMIYTANRDHRVTSGCNCLRRTRQVCQRPERAAGPARLHRHLDPLPPVQRTAGRALHGTARCP